MDGVFSWGVVCCGVLALTVLVMAAIGAVLEITIGRRQPTGQPVPPDKYDLTAWQNWLDQVINKAMNGITDWSWSFDGAYAVGSNKAKTRAVEIFRLSHAAHVANWWDGASDTFDGHEIELLTFECDEGLAEEKAIPTLRRWMQDSRVFELGLDSPEEISPGPEDEDRDEGDPDEPRGEVSGPTGSLFASPSSLRRHFGFPSPEPESCEVPLPGGMKIVGPVDVYVGGQHLGQVSDCTVNPGWSASGESPCCVGEAKISVTFEPASTEYAAFVKAVDKIKEGTEPSRPVAETFPAKIKRLWDGWPNKPDDWQLEIGLMVATIGNPKLLAGLYLCEVGSRTYEPELTPSWRSLCFAPGATDAAIVHMIDEALRDIYAREIHKEDQPRLEATRTADPKPTAEPTAEPSPFFVLVKGIWEQIRDRPKSWTLEEDKLYATDKILECVTFGEDGEERDFVVINGKPPRKNEDEVFKNGKTTLWFYAHDHGHWLKNALTRALYRIGKA